VRVVVYTPKNVDGPLPLVVETHGGGFVALRADTLATLYASYALLGATVVSVDYRRAPEHPFPAAPEDCYAALVWAVAHLEVDSSRVIVTGGSAGGALAAALTLMARDRGGPRISFQALTVPVLDDRLQTPSMHEYVEAPLFGARNAEGMWLHYLGDDYDRRSTSPYAAPARADDLRGLPPAFIHVNGCDPLRDEGIEYAMRLMAAGVPVELYCAPGAHHGTHEGPAIMHASQLHHAALAAALCGDS
jgi:acetyl esterase/lipase